MDADREACMSHLLASVADIAPTPAGELLVVSSSAAFGASMYPLFRSISFSAIAVPAGKNIPFGRSSYNQTTFGTGASFTLSTTTSVIAAQYAADWFDFITLPAGSWVLMAHVGQDTAYAPTGRYAWVNQSTGARLGPLCSTRDVKRSTYAIGFVTSASAVSVALRVLTTGAYKPNQAGVGRTAISFHKWQ